MTANARWRGGLQAANRAPLAYNESGPEGASTPESPGLTPASLDGTEEQRLVPILEPPTEGVKTPPPASSQLCPNCSAESFNPLEVSSGTTHLANYVCPDGHGFTVWWKTGGV